MSEFLCGDWACFDLSCPGNKYLQVVVNIFPEEKDMMRNSAAVLDDMIVAINDWTRSAVGAALDDD
ncbi:hypothetical protein FAM23877_06015 [Propionibacterium freudenreichii]|uniref:hypothetical protein n=1 Tax=Propionibacterium freudenreichii TaxID=1744 RepID=UPI000AE7A09E|nr:hypothetical protein [Propionibacterium freudenreichii]WGU91433.1 hypothetical protein FAM23877_06015 [Propionibacterium freudenreichii]